MPENKPNISQENNDTIYWVERVDAHGNSEIFMMNRKECQRKFYENTSIYNYEWNFIGKTDGETLRNEQKKNNEEVKKLEEREQELKRRLDRYVEKEDELLFEELVEDDNEKLQRVKERQEETRDKLDEIQNKLSDMRGAAFEEAWEKELAKARENDTELPPAPSDVIESERNSQKEQQQIKNLLE